MKRVRGFGCSDPLAKEANHVVLLPLASLPVPIIITTGPGGLTRILLRHMARHRPARSGMSTSNTWSPNRDAGATPA
jgi:hypothetical protein